MKNNELVEIKLSILIIRNQRVLISSDLANLYGVLPKVLIQAVKRNASRFPEDFMFQLTIVEWSNLKSQNVTSSWGGSRIPPYAFTEQGVAMLSSVLNSDRAIKVNIEIMRTFVKMRKLVAEHKDLATRLDILEDRYDEQFKIVFDAIRELMNSPEPEKRPIGFTADISKVKS